MYERSGRHDAHQHHAGPRGRADRLIRAREALDSRRWRDRQRVRRSRQEIPDPASVPARFRCEKRKFACCSRVGTGRGQRFKSRHAEQRAVGVALAPRAMRARALVRGSASSARRNVGPFHRCAAVMGDVPAEPSGFADQRRRLEGAGRCRGWTSAKAGHARRQTCLSPNGHSPGPGGGSPEITVHGSWVLRLPFRADQGVDLPGSTSRSRPSDGRAHARSKARCRGR